MHSWILLKWHLMFFPFTNQVVFASSSVPALRPQIVGQLEFGEPDEHTFSWDIFTYTFRC